MAKTLTANEQLIIDAAAAVDQTFARKYNREYKKNIGTSTDSSLTSVYFNINGLSGGGQPMPAGTIVNSTIYVLNKDSVPHVIKVSATENYNDIDLTNGVVVLGTWTPPETQALVGPGQTASLALTAFTMPNVNDFINYWVWVDDVTDNSGKMEIDIPVVLTTLTSITNFIEQSEAEEGAAVPFSAVITNISKTALNINVAAQINVDGVISKVSWINPPNPINLAPNETQKINGSFVMPASANTDLYITTSVMSNVAPYNYIADAKYLADLPTIISGNPKLVISNTVIGQGGSIAYSFSGFVPNTAVNLVVTTNSNEYNITASDGSGSGNGSMEIVDGAGNYTLKATDEYGNVATATFTVTSPATIKTVISPVSCGTVSVSPSGTYKSGQTVTLTAKPANGYYFGYWTLPDGTTAVDNPHSWVLQGGQNSITAVFSPNNVPIDKQANLVIPISPAGAGTVSPSIEAPYSVGESPILTATPVSGYYFAYWTYNGQQVTTNPITITLVAGTNTITAVFTTTPPSPTPVSKNWWDKLTKTEQNLIIGGGAVVLVGGIVAIIVMTGKKSK